MQTTKTLNKLREGAGCFWVFVHMYSDDIAVNNNNYNNNNNNNKSCVL